MNAVTSSALDYRGKAVRQGENEATSAGARSGINFLGTVAPTFAFVLDGTAVRRRGTRDCSTVAEPGEAALEGSTSPDGVPKELLSDSKP